MLCSTFRTGGRAVQSGFTLVELCIALAVAGILIAVAMPAMASFHAKTAVAAQANGLMSALRLAKQEAMTRGELVSVCAMDPATADSAQPGCLPSGRDWSAGWIVFIDRGERGDIGDGDRIVSVNQAGDNKGGALGTLRYVTFRPAGAMLSISSHFRFLPPGEPLVDAAVENSALLCVNKTGRPRLTESDDCAG
jgi:type IV fimbrial biogenesis protein FimT